MPDNRAQDDLVTIHNGIKASIDAIQRKDYSRATDVLTQIDRLMVELLHRLGIK